MKLVLNGMILARNERSSFTSTGDLYLSELLKVHNTSKRIDKKGRKHRNYEKLKNTGSINCYVYLFTATEILHNY